ncbi:MAG: DUF4064 domain-containing protein [Halobacteriota archaeon]
MGRPFWLGIIGGIFGILAGIGVALIAGILGDFSGTLHTVLVRVNEVYNSTGSSGFHTIVIVSNVPELYASAAGAILFSVVGIIGGILEKSRILGGAFMIIGAIGVLFSVGILGILSFILFVVGGFLIFIERR